MGSNPAAETVKVALGLINLQFKNAITTAMVISSLVWDRYSRSFTVFILWFVLFTRRVKKNSKDCPVSSVFIAQLVEPSSTNAEITGTNPAEALNLFFLIRTQDR